MGANEFVGSPEVRNPRGSAARNAVRLLVLATVLLYCALGATFTTLYIGARHQRESLKQIADQTHQVQCAQEVNLRTQLDGNKQYLADVAAGRRQRIPGITDIDIQLAMKRTALALKAYKGLNCEDTK